MADFPTIGRKESLAITWGEWPSYVSMNPDQRLNNPSNPGVMSFCFYGWLIF